MIKCDPKAFMKCPVRMKHCKTEAEAYFCDGSDCHKFNQKILSEPKTNADRIRAMSDEELAHFMVERNLNESTLQLFDKDYALTAVQIEALKQRLYCACMKWLKQPAEGDNNEA